MTVEQIINGIIAREGGYINHPDDAGGPTNYGITLRLYKKYKPSATVQELKVLTKAQAYQIYESEFYRNTKIDKLNQFSQKLTEEVLDTAVNMGPGTAIRFLQRTLNALNMKGQLYSDIDTDGGLGDRTIQALQGFYGHRGQAGDQVLLKALNCLQAVRYIELAEANMANESFLYGWLDNRIVVQ